MALPGLLANRLSIPVIASPMFIISSPELVIAQCRAGVVGSLPSLNARADGEFENWLTRLDTDLSDADAPFAVNLIVHRSNHRLETDLALCVKHQVPIVITSLGARADVNEAIHSYGGLVLHDVIDDRFAHKAVEKGADGLIAVATGAGGHAGTISPFALIGEIRRWFNGPLILSGAIASGDAILAARAIGADLAYIGSAFIATFEANADSAYKQMVTTSSSADILYSNLFTGIHGNYLKPSISRAGLDPETLPSSNAAQLDFNTLSNGKKVWKDIWGCGQGIGAIDTLVSAADLIRRFQDEYAAALERIARPF